LRESIILIPYFKLFFSLCAFIGIMYVYILLSKPLHIVAFVRNSLNNCYWSNITVTYICMKGSWYSPTMIDLKNMWRCMDPPIGSRISYSQSGLPYQQWCYNCWGRNPHPSRVWSAGKL
jgi:hypothetical protein